ncbi:MAG: hypothetical protein FGM39_06820 [Phycisphaerales bacterium]|nr:hypothetical protein [Phycisphaerales bacterium]
MARGISRTLHVPALAGALLAAGAASAESLLLVGDSNGDKFWAFSAITGALISDNYIPDDGQMAQPRQCVRVPSGTWYIGEPGVGLGCSAADGVIEHSSPGVFVRRVQDQSTGICDVNAICLRDGKVWIGRGDSIANAAGGLNGIYSMNLDGSGLLAVARPPGMVSLRGMAPVAGGFIVSDYSSSSANPANRLLRISTDGQSVTVFHQPEAGALTFPQQVSPLPNGGVVVAGFSGNPGLYFFNADGTPGTPSYYRTQGPTWTVISPRGCYPLENGKVLYAGGTVVGVVDPVMQEEFIIVNAVSPTGTAIANFSAISRIDIAECPADFNDDGSVDGNDLGFLLASWGAPGGSADLNGDGSVDGNDLGFLLAAWGPCPG